MSENFEELEEEIRSIKTSEPYTLRELLEDVVQRDQKMKEFEEEKDTYSKYKEELGRNLKELQEN